MSPVDIYHLCIIAGFTEELVCRAFMFGLLFRYAKTGFFWAILLPALYIFTWTIQEEEGKQPLLNLAYQGDLDSDDIWDGDYPFKIVKLTDTFMWWQVNTIGDNSIVKIRRHADINLTRDFMRQIY